MPQKLRDLTDVELTATIESKSSGECNLTVEVIELLEEFERRKVYLKLGFGSLLEYCVKELRYSESSAYRRIAAMRVSREIPEVKDHIRNGSLNLVNVARAQSYFRAEEKNCKAYSKAEKREILSSIENKSKREAERIMVERSQFVKPAEEKCIPVKNRKFELTLQIDEAIMEKIERVKAMISHKNPDANLVECLEAALDMALAKLEKKSSKGNSPERGATPPVVAVKKYITAPVRREVWRKAEGKCCFVSSENQQRCNSAYQLEVDHILPVALGGTSEIENLRLVCRAHNQHYARIEFGEEFMRQFEKSS